MEKETFALLATLMIFASRAYYFAQVFRGNTRPHAFSWFIWGVISSIGVAAQIAEGAGVGSYPRLFGAISCFVIVAICFKHGEKNITRTDWITLLVALSTIPLWVATQTPIYSVILVCLIDTMGYLPTVRKAWHKPQQEAFLGYYISGVGAFFSILAIETYTPSTWLYAAVLTATNLMMGSYLFLRRRSVPVAIPAVAAV